jgi:hypothetical protein
LDGLLHWVVEVINLLPNNKADATDDGGAIAVVVALHIEDFPPKTPVGINAEEGFADSDEDRKVKDGVWGQLPEPNPVKEKKGAEKLVGMKRETTEQESSKHNSKALRRPWARNRTWKTNVIVR